MSNYIKTMFPQASISTRSDTAVSKPAVFHSETKRRLQLEVQNKRKNGNFLKGQRKNVSFCRHENEPEHFRTCRSSSYIFKVVCVLISYFGRV